MRHNGHHSLPAQSAPWSGPSSRMTPLVPVTDQPTPFAEKQHEHGDQEQRQRIANSCHITWTPWHTSRAYEICYSMHTAYAMACLNGDSRAPEALVISLQLDPHQEGGPERLHRRLQQLQRPREAVPTCRPIPASVPRHRLWCCATAFIIDANKLHKLTARLTPRCSRIGGVNSV